MNRGAVYSTCPSAGGAGGGTQPYPEALAAGLAVNVGIDTHSNDMVENVKLAVLQGQARAALLQEVGAGRPVRAPTVEDAIQGCTEIPARALGRPDLGVIEPGALADLVAVHVSGPLSGSGAPAPEPLNNLLYANGRFVSWVFVDGRPLVSDGQFALDLGTIVSAGGARCRAPLGAAGRRGLVLAGHNANDQLPGARPRLHEPVRLRQLLEVPRRADNGPQAMRFHELRERGPHRE